jgi:hypothetical protein
MRQLTPYQSGVRASDARTSVFTALSPDDAAGDAPYAHALAMPRASFNADVAFDAA